MFIKKGILIVVLVTLSACNLVKNNSYEQPAINESGSVFIYTPDSQQKNADAVTIYIDNLKAGDVSENRPLQVPVAAGWHKLSVHTRSILMKKEELAKFDILIEKDVICYVRYAKQGDIPVNVLAGSPVFGVVDEDSGRQMK